MELWHEVKNDGGGPTVLWLHGALVSSWMWTPQIEAMPDVRSVLVDLPGHGKSVHREWVDFEDTADAVLAVLDQVGATGPVHLVGMSLGAIVALHVMALAPERIGRAVLTGGQAEPVPRILTWANLAVGALTQLPGAEGLVARALQLPPEAREGFHEAGLALDRRSFFRINDQLVSDFLPEGLDAVPCPTLLLAGSEEPTLTMRAQRLLRDTLPHAEAAIAPGCHHAWSGEKPALFTATVQAWLDGSALPEEMLPVEA